MTANDAKHILNAQNETPCVLFFEIKHKTPESKNNTDDIECNIAHILSCFLVFFFI